MSRPEGLNFKKARWMPINQKLIVDSNQYITTLICSNCGHYHYQTGSSPKIREAELPTQCYACGSDMEGTNA